MGCTYSQRVALQNSSGSNREEPIIFNRREDISPKVPQPNAKKQVNTNSQQRAWRPESAAPRTEPLRQPGPPGVDGAPGADQYLGSRGFSRLILLAVTGAALALRVRGAVRVAGALRLSAAGMC